eukprot:1159795-Pelagomonas_calceolata.AAC.3
MFQEQTLPHKFTTSSKQAPCSVFVAGVGSLPFTPSSLNGWNKQEAPCHKFQPIVFCVCWWVTHTPSSPGGGHQVGSTMPQLLTTFLNFYAGVGGSQDSPGSPGGRKKRTLGGAAAAAAERRAQQQQVDGALAGEEGGQQRRAAGEEEEHDALPQSPVFWSKSKRRLGGAAAASAAAAAARRAHEQHLQQQQQQQQGEKGGSGHGESEDDILEEAKGATAGRLGSEQGLQGRGREGERKSTRGQALAKREGVSGTHHRGANADTSRAAKETSAMGDLRPVKNTRQQQQQQRQPHRRSAAAAAAAAGAAKRTLDTPAVVDSEEEEFVGGGSSSSDSSDSDSGLQGVGLSRESTDEGMSDVSSEGGVNESSDSGAWEDNEEGARRADRTSGADGRKGRRQGSVARGGRLKSRGGSGALGLGSAAGEEPDPYRLCQA